MDMSASEVADTAMKLEALDTRYFVSKMKL